MLRVLLSKFYLLQSLSHIVTDTPPLCNSNALTHFTHRQQRHTTEVCHSQLMLDLQYHMIQQYWLPLQCNVIYPISQLRQSISTILCYNTHTHTHTLSLSLSPPLSHTHTHMSKCTYPHTHIHNTHTHTQGNTNTLTNSLNTVFVKHLGQNS